MPGSVTRHRRSHDRFVEARVFLGEIPEEKMGMSTGALPSYNTLQRFEARCRNGAIMRAAEQEALAAFDKTRPGSQPTDNEVYDLIIKAASSRLEMIEPAIRDLFYRSERRGLEWVEHLLSAAPGDITRRVAAFYRAAAEQVSRDEGYFHAVPPGRHEEYRSFLLRRAEEIEKNGVTVVLSCGWPVCEDGPVGKN